MTSVTPDFDMRAGAIHDLANAYTDAFIRATPDDAEPWESMTAMVTVLASMIAASARCCGQRPDEGIAIAQNSVSAITHALFSELSVGMN